MMSANPESDDSRSLDVKSSFDEKSSAPTNGVSRGLSGASKHENLRKEICEFLTRLVEVDSSNPPGGEAGVLEIIQDFAANHGLESKVFPALPGRSNLVLRLSGQQPDQALAFTGHMDVMPVHEAERRRWRSDPFVARLEGDKLYARGSCDMKGGLVCALLAMSTAAREQTEGRLKLPHDVYLLCTVDEESDMRGSKALLKEDFLRRIETLVVCEPTGLKLCTQGGGRSYGRISLSGQAGHASQHQANVIDAAADLITRLESNPLSEEQDDNGHRNFWQVLGIRTDQTPYVIPDQLSLDLDARLLPDFRTADVWEKFTAVAAETEQRYPQFHISTEVLDRREGWTLKNDAFSLCLSHVLAAAGIPEVRETFYGTTDASRFVTAGLSAVIFGPGDLALAHRENEYLELEQACRATRFYFQLMQEGEHRA